MGIFRAFRYLRLLGCLGVIAIGGIGLLADGISRRQIAAEDMAKYRQPTTLTCDEFVRRQPTYGWFRVTDCASDATDATFVVTIYGHDHDSDEKTASHTDVSEVVLPVYGKNDDTDSPAHVAVVANNPALCSIVNDMDKEGFFETKPLHDEFSTSTDSSDSSDTDKSGDSADTDKKNKADKKSDDAQEQHMVAFVKKNIDRIATVRTIEGMVRNVDDLDTDQRKALMHNSDKFAPRYLLLVEGETPSGNASSASLESVAGGAISVVMLLIFGAIGFAAFGRRGGGNDGIGGNGGGGNSYARPTYPPQAGAPGTGPFYNPPAQPTGGPVSAPPANHQPWSPTPPVVYPPAVPPQPQTPPSGPPTQPSQPWSLD